MSLDQIVPAGTVFVFVVPAIVIVREQYPGTVASATVALVYCKYPGSATVLYRVHDA